MSNRDRNKVYIIGAAAGLVVGLLAAYIVVQRAQETDQLPRITAGDGVKVGLGIMGVLRLISEFAEA
ncbi:MAG TPA: hypothetical protein GYA06_09200 [Chloroflexi bacterium]|jgi:hypothetical protein|nr:hypothetical protein [Chloroflexota bacterium]HPO58139.1 hypothetical protein [Anaerolineaceae bacterium]